MQRTIRRDAQGRPYVPASALKGALRMSAERVVTRLNEALRDLGAEPHQLLGQRQRGPALLRGERCRAPHIETMCQSAEPCVVCRIFGNVFTGTRLTVDDAHPEVSASLQRTRQKLLSSEDHAELLGGVVTPQPWSETRTQLRIDRRRRAAFPGALFTSSYAVAGLTFHTQLSGFLQVADPPPNQEAPLEAFADPTRAPTELVLLAAALRYCDQVGAHASTGHGLCRLDVEALHVGAAETHRYEVDALIDQLGGALLWANLNR